MKLFVSISIYFVVLTGFPTFYHISGGIFHGVWKLRVFLPCHATCSRQGKKILIHLNQLLKNCLLSYGKKTEIKILHNTKMWSKVYFHYFHNVNFVLRNCNILLETKEIKICIAFSVEIECLILKINYKRNLSDSSRITLKY